MSRYVHLISLLCNVPCGAEPINGGTPPGDTSLGSVSKAPPPDD